MLRKATHCIKRRDARTGMKFYLKLSIPVAQAVPNNVAIVLTVHLLSGLVEKINIKRHFQNVYIPFSNGGLKANNPCHGCSSTAGGNFYRDCSVASDICSGSQIERSSCVTSSITACFRVKERSVKPID